MARCFCCCKGPPNLFQTCSSCTNSVAPHGWRTTMSGITSGTCFGGFCGAVNRDWFATPVSQCFWQESFDTAFTCAGNTGWRFQISIFFSASFHRIFAAFRAFDAGDPPTGGSVFRNYEKTSLVTFDCLASHTLSDIGPFTANECAIGSWPASIIVEPSTSLFD